MVSNAKKSGSGLQSFRTLPSFRLHMLARLSERFYEHFYRRELGLSLLECRIIGIIGGFGQVSFKRVCDEANLDKSHASRLVNRLMRRRLLQKVGNPSDHRSVLLALTGAGQQCHHEMHSWAAELTDEWLSPLGRDARKAFQDALATLTEQIRAMSEATSRRKGRPTSTRARVKPANGNGHALAEVMVDRKMARQLYDLLGTALRNGHE